jgi:hypothetical protein
MKATCRLWIYILIVGLVPVFAYAELPNTPNSLITPTTPVPTSNLSPPNNAYNNPVESQWMQLQQQDIYNEQERLGLQIQQQKLQQARALQQKQRQLQEAREHNVDQILDACNKMDLNNASFQMKARCQAVKHHVEYHTPVTDKELGITP